MQRTTVGKVELIALVDTIQTYPATAIYPEAGDALAPFRGYCDTDGGVALNFACFLVRDGTTTILVDTGWGPRVQRPAFPGARLGKRRSRLGRHRHLQPPPRRPHLLESDRSSGQPLFPNARYLVPRRDWDHYGAQTPPPDSFTRDIAPLEALGKLELLDGETALSPSVTAIATPGHTPGHTSFAITSGGQHGYVLGDVVLSPIDAEEPGFVTSFDWDRLMAVQTRRKVIGQLAASGALVGASHLPAPGLGRFVSAGGKSSWQPS